MYMMRLVGCLFLVVAASARGAAPPPLRVDLLGDPLPQGAIARLGTYRLRQPDFINFVVLSRDGKLAAAASVGDKDVYLWELPSGKRRAVLRGKGGRVQSLALSPDGTTLASSNSAGTVRLWDTRTGKLSNTIVLPKGVVQMAFSPDGKTLAVSSYKAGVTLWDHAKGIQERELSDEKCSGTVAFAPDGRTLASSREDGEIVLWDPRTGREKGRLLGHEAAVRGLTFSADRKTLASAAYDKTIRIWDVTARKQTRRIAVEHVWSHDLRFIDDDKSLLGVSHPMRLTRWDLRTGKGTTLWEDDQHIIYGVDFTPDGRTAIFGSINGPHHLRRLDLVAKREVFVAPGHMSYVSNLVFTPDSKSVVTSAWMRGDSVVRMWDSGTGRLQREFGGHVQGAKELAISPDGTVLVTTVWYGPAIRLWDLRAGTLLRKLEVQSGNPTSVAFSADGNTLASGHSYYNRAGRQVGQVKLWNVRTGMVVHTLPEEKSECRASFAGDGRTLVTSGESTSHWDVASGKRTRHFDSRHNLPFSRDGRLAANFGLKELGIREILTGKLLFEMPGRKRVAALSADGRMFATVDLDDTVIRFWDMLDGTSIGKLVGLQGAEVTSLIFSPDGKVLASGQQDSTALIWDLHALRPAPVLPRLPLDLAQAWTALGNPDPGPAYRAVRALALEPVRASTYLERRLRPPTVAKQEDIVRWIRDLDAEEFEKREAGSEALANAGRTVELALREALEEEPSLEKRQRIRRLLRTLETDGYAKDELRAYRALAALERMNTDAARRVLKRLAGGDPASPFTQDAAASLGRLMQRTALNR